LVDVGPMTGSSRQQSVNHTYKPSPAQPTAAPVATWTQVDVQQWLSSMQLTQHADRLILKLITLTPLSQHTTLHHEPACLFCCDHNNSNSYG